MKLKRSSQASLGGLPSLQHSRENSDLESSDCSRLVPQPLPLNASNGSTSNGHTSSSFQGKTVLEDTRWFVFALIVSPNRPGHYFVGGNDPVCLVSKERQDAESWSLRKTTIGLIRDDFWVNKWAILNSSIKRSSYCFFDIQPNLDKNFAKQSINHGSVITKTTSRPSPP